MMSLPAELSAIVGRAFEAEGFAPSFGTVQASDRPDLAQFQCNGALAAAKQAKTNPRALADKVVLRLKADPLFAKVEIAGPGFINLDITDAALTERVRAMTADAGWARRKPARGASSSSISAGPTSPSRCMWGICVPPSSATACNVSFAPMAGTSRATCIWATGACRWASSSPRSVAAARAPIYFDANYAGPYPETSPVTMDDLEEIYPAASAACKEDPSRLDEARAATAELQAGRPGYRALWRHFFTVSEVGLNREYASLGVSFDLWKGEADVDPLIAPMVEDLKAKGLAVMSEGALVIPVAERRTRRKCRR